MPALTLEQIKKRESRLAKAVAGIAATEDAATRRTKRKQLKRAQRRRRRMTSEAKRQAERVGKSGAAESPSGE